MPVAVLREPCRPLETHSFRSVGGQDIPGLPATRVRPRARLLVRNYRPITRILAGTDMPEVSVSFVRSSRLFVAFATNTSLAAMSSVVACETSLFARVSSFLGGNTMKTNSRLLLGESTDPGSGPPKSAKALALAATFAVSLVGFQSAFGVGSAIAGPSDKPDLRIAMLTTWAAHGPVVNSNFAARIAAPAIRRSAAAGSDCARPDQRPETGGVR